MLKKSLLTLIAIFFTACCLQPNLVYAGWHEWSQMARNEAILNAAYKDLNKKVNVSCKVWVQNVVKNASNGAVAVPQTVDPPGYYWYPSKYVFGRSGRIEDVKSGEIVQMDLKDYKDPHTAIVWQVGTCSLTFIECNWCDNNCQIVRIRSVSFSTFYNQVVNFTINSIL